MTKKGGLGRGLGDLLGLNELNVIDESTDKIEQIKPENITPNVFQPRKAFRKEELEELAKSIKELGVLQPVIVRKSVDGKYELVAGERRLRAAKMAGIEKLPAVVREYSNQEVMQIALVENLQRADLNAIEIALAYKNLIEECSLTQEKLAERLGKSRTSIANTMRLLHLPQEVQEMIAAGLLTEGQARPLLALNNSEMQQQLSARITEEALSARAVEELVREMLAVQDEKTEATDPTVEEDALSKNTSRTGNVAELYINEAKERMQDFFGTKVYIKRGKNKGKIEIEFYSPDDLVRIIENVLHGGSVDDESGNVVSAAKNFVV